MSSGNSGFFGYVSRMDMKEIEIIHIPYVSQDFLISLSCLSL